MIRWVSCSSGGTTVFIGHTQLVDNGGGPHALAVSLSDKEVGQPGSPGQMGAGRVVPNAIVGSLGTEVPAEPPRVSPTSTVAIFGCDSSNLSGQYAGAQTFVGVDSGTNTVTSVDGLVSAGATFVNSLASGKDVTTAVSDAQSKLQQVPKYDSGDKIVQEKEKK